MQTIERTEGYSRCFLSDYGSPMDIGEIQKAVRDSGSHFFDSDTMRFFRSRCDNETFTAPNGWLFVTSEQRRSMAGSLEAREYTVRALCVHDGRLCIQTMGTLGQFSTLRRARAAARRFMESKRMIQAYQDNPIK